MGEQTTKVADQIEELDSRPWEERSKDWRLGFISGVALVTQTLAEALEEISGDILNERNVIIEGQGDQARQDRRKHDNSDPGRSEQADGSPAS